MTGSVQNPSAQAFYAARAFLQEHRLDYDTALRDFSWPEIDEFNFALDHFDAVAADPERGAERALWIVEGDGSEAHWTFAELSERSNRVANWLRGHGVARGDRIILMLGNQVELWETMLAAMKLGAVVIPATTLLTASDLRDRLDRGAAKHVVVGGTDAGKFDDVEGDYTKIAVRGAPEGWLDYADADDAPAEFTPDGVTKGSRHAAAVLHLRHHGEAQARRAHPRQLPGRASVHDVLDRAASPATSTSTSPRPAGPSTRGATSSRRGSPSRASSS